MSMIERMGRNAYSQTQRAIASRERALSISAGRSQEGGVFYGEPSKTGEIAIDEYMAVSLTTVWACVDLIASSIAETPMDVVDRRTGRLLDPQPMYSLLNQPDPFLTYEEAIATTQVNCLLLGNCWWRVVARWRGIVECVEVLLDRDVQVFIDPFTHRIKNYHVRRMEIDPKDMIHFKGLSFAGEPLGVSPIARVRRTLANAIGQDQAAEQSLVTGSAARGHFEHAGEPNQKLANKVRKGWAADVAGRNATPFVVPGDLRWVSDTMNPADLQLLESRQFSQREICTLFRVPPHMVGVPAADSKTYQNANMDDRAFAKRTLGGQMNRMASKLTTYMPPGEQVRFQPARVVEPSDLDRVRKYKLLRDMKAITADEIREKEGEPPLTEAQKAELAAEPVAALGPGSPEDVADAVVDATTGENAPARLALPELVP